IARSAPLARASRSTCWARAGPLVITTTSPLCLSRWRSASSSAYASGSLTSYETSSRIHAPVSLSLSGTSFCGTCFMQTRIFKSRTPSLLWRQEGMEKRVSINERAVREEMRPQYFFVIRITKFSRAEEYAHGSVAPAPCRLSRGRHALGAARTYQCGGFAAGLTADETLFRKNDRLHARDIEPLPAAHILAGHHVVFAQHVRPGLGEAGAVALVGAARKLPLLGAYHPSHLVFRRLVAMRTIQRSDFLLLLLVKKIALFHGIEAGSVRPRPTMNYCTFNGYTILKRRLYAQRATLGRVGNELKTAWPKRKKQSAFAP